MSITFTQKKMHIISAQNTHQRPSFRSIFQNFLGEGPPNHTSGRGSPPPTPRPVSSLPTSKCPYRPLAPCPFQILAGSLHVACNIPGSCKANGDRKKLWAWLYVNNLWHTSYLSVQTNTRLTVSWNRHADNVTKKANSKIGFLKRNIRSAPQAAKETAYNYRASDFFQDWWAAVTHGAKNGGSFSGMMGPSISN